MLKRNTVELMKDGHLVHHFLLASFAYYVLHQSPLTDDAFDHLCKRLLERYDHFEHPHKKFIDKEMLQAGTAYNLKEADYPLIVQHGAESYIARCMSGALTEHFEKEYGGQRALF